MQDETSSTSPGKTSLEIFLCSPQWPPGGRRAQGTQSSLKLLLFSYHRGVEEAFPPMSKPTAKIKNKLPQQPKIIVKVTDMVHDHMAAAVHMQVH